MTAALMTLTFLVASWAAFVVVVSSLDDSGGKIVAALKGRSLRSEELAQVREVTVRFSPRYPSRPQPVRVAAKRAPTEWRAAA